VLRSGEKIKACGVQLGEIQKTDLKVGEEEGRRPWRWKLRNGRTGGHDLKKEGSGRVGRKGALGPRITKVTGAGKKGSQKKRRGSKGEELLPGRIPGWEESNSWNSSP